MTFTFGPIEYGLNDTGLPAKQSGFFPGRQYRIRLTNGSWTIGRFISERHYETRRSPKDFYTIYSRAKVHYIFENIATGCTIEIKSRARIKDI